MAPLPLHLTNSYSTNPPAPAANLVQSNDLDVWWASNASVAEAHTTDYAVGLTGPSHGATSTAFDMAQFMISIMRQNARIGCKNQVVDGTTLREWLHVKVGRSGSHYHGMPWEPSGVYVPGTEYIMKAGENPGMSNNMVLDPTNRMGFFITSATAASGMSAAAAQAAIATMTKIASDFGLDGTDMSLLTQAFGADLANFNAYQPSGDQANYIGLYMSADNASHVEIKAENGILVVDCQVTDMCSGPGWWETGSAFKPLISLGQTNSMFVDKQAASMGPPPHIVVTGRDSENNVQTMILEGGTFWTRQFENNPTNVVLTRVR